jgi:hypothetical protein
MFLTLVAGFDSPGLHSVLNNYYPSCAETRLKGFLQSLWMLVACRVHIKLQGQQQTGLAGFITVCWVVCGKPPCRLSLHQPACVRGLQAMLLMLCSASSALLLPAQ